MDLAGYIQELHFEIHDCVRAAIAKESAASLSEIISKANGDVAYKIDAYAETIIDAYFTARPPEGGAVVVCEGLGVKTYPAMAEGQKAKYKFLIDPLDGTCEIMYDKRSCWILTGVALNRGDENTLQDVFLAVQTEVSCSNTDRSVALSACRGEGAVLTIWNVAERKRISEPAGMQCSAAHDIRHGFSVFVNFFPGTKEIISAIDERVTYRLLGKPESDSALVFTDQYISTAGQLYLLATGKYRLVADFRAYLSGLQAAKGERFSICCHPYDLATVLILSEAGGFVTDAAGHLLDFPMDLDTNCSWLGYANEKIKESAEPVLLEELEKVASSVPLERLSAQIGLVHDSEIMGAGEAEFRTSLGSGSSYVCSAAPSYGLWQKAHYHKQTTETVIVEEGMAACVELRDNECTIKLFHKGEHFIVTPFVHHNIYMFPNAITHTLYYSGTPEKDWYPSDIVEAWCKSNDPLHRFADHEVV